MYFKLKAPKSGTITFRAYVDDSIQLFINGNQLINQGGGWTSSSSMTMTSGQLYDGYVVYKEGSSTARVHLYWSYSGRSRIIVPTNYYYYPTYISSPMQFTIN